MSHYGHGARILKTAHTESVWQYGFRFIKEGGDDFTALGIRPDFSEVLPKFGAPTPEAAPAHLAAATFGDGVFRIPNDILPGTYRTSDSSQGCYWARLSGFSDITANSFSKFLQGVTISTSDVGFESTRCGTWTLTNN